MIDAGLTMLRGLTILSDQVDNLELRRVLRSVKQDVEGGMSLSASFAKNPDVFPPLMVNMTRAGEAGGFLDVTMRQIADNFEAEVRLRGKIKAALTYPVVVFVLAIVMCMGMLVFVVPVFKSMFEGLGGELPLPTQVLVFLSESMRFMLPVLIVAVHRHGLVVAQVRQDRAGPQRRRPAQAEAARVRQAGPEARPRPLLPQPQHAAVLRGADPAVARHRLGDDRVRRHLPGAQAGAGVGAPR